VGEEDTAAFTVAVHFAQRFVRQLSLPYWATTGDSRLGARPGVRQDTQGVPAKQDA